MVPLGSIVSGAAPATNSIRCAGSAQGECRANLGLGAPRKLVSARPKLSGFPFRQHTQTFEGSDLDKAMVKQLRVVNVLVLRTEELIQRVADERDIFLSVSDRSWGCAGEMIDMHGPDAAFAHLLTSMPPEGKES